MNSSFSVDDEDSSHFGDGDDADALSSTSSVVLVLPDDDQSQDESEDCASGNSAPFMVGNVPLYLAQGEDGKPVYIRQLASLEKSPNAKASGGDEHSGFGGFSEASGRTFEGFGSVAFEGFGEYSCDSEEKVHFDGFSEEDSAESVGGKEKIVRLRKLQKLYKLASDQVKDELLDDDDDSDEETEVNIGNNSKNKSKMAKVKTEEREMKKQNGDEPRGKRSKRKRFSKDSAEGMDIGKVRNSPLLKRQKQKMGTETHLNHSSNKADKSTSEYSYHSEFVEVKDEDIEIKEEASDDYDFIGIYCQQVGCTITWLESMKSKEVTVNNGIVYELSEFAKKINWEREHVVKWIMRLRGILDIEPSQEDLDKIHITLKRRKALTVTLSGSKKGHLKLYEFDSTDFTLPSCIQKEVEKGSILNLPQCNNLVKRIVPEAGGRKHTDNQQRKVSKIKESRGSETQNSPDDSMPIVKDPREDEDPKVSYHYYGTLLMPYFKENCPIGPCCQAAGLTISDLNSMNKKDIFISQGMVIELWNFFHERKCYPKSLAFWLLNLKNLPHNGWRPLLSKISKFKEHVTDDEDFLNAEFQFPIKGHEPKIRKGDGEIHSDTRVSFYVHNGFRNPHFKESNAYLGKYCSAIGLTVDHLNSKEIMDFHITQGVAVELFTFYRDRSCSLRSIAETIARLGKGHSAKLNSMISTVWTVMKKAKNANEEFFKAKFPFPTARPGRFSEERHAVVEEEQLESLISQKDENGDGGKDIMRKDGRPARKRTKKVKYQDEENVLRQTKGKRKKMSIQNTEKHRKRERGKNTRHFSEIQQDFSGVEQDKSHRVRYKRLRMEQNINQSDFQHDIARKDVLVLRPHVLDSQQYENGLQDSESEVESGQDYFDNTDSGQENSGSEVDVENTVGDNDIIKRKISSGIKSDRQKAQNPRSAGMLDVGKRQWIDSKISIKTDAKESLSRPEGSTVKILKSGREHKLSERMKASQKSWLYGKPVKEEPEDDFKGKQSVGMSKTLQTSSIWRKTIAGFPKRSRLISKEDDRVSFLTVNGHVIPYFKEKNFYLGDHCSAAGLTVQDLNSDAPKVVHLTNGVVLELFRFYRDRGCTNIALADRILRMKNLRRVNLAYISSRFPQLLYIENDEKKLRSEFKFRCAKVFPNADRPSSVTLENGVTPGDVMLREIKKEDGTSGCVCEDSLFANKVVEKARGKDGSVTRADIVLLYGEWLKKKRYTSSEVFVTDLLRDVMKLMEDRKIQKIRIPAGTLMSSSVKLYDEYRQMWYSNRKDAMLYLEEDWLEDIRYLVSITQTSRRSTADGESSGMEVDGGVSQLEERSSSIDISVGNVDAKLPSHKGTIISDDEGLVNIGKKYENAMKADKGILKDASIIKRQRNKSREDKGAGSSGEIMDNSNGIGSEPKQVPGENDFRRKPGPKSKRMNFDVPYEDEHMPDCNGDTREVVLERGSDASLNEEILPAFADKNDKKIFNKEGCEISQIIDYRCEVDEDIGKKQTSYLVRWKGFGPEYDSWVKEEDLRCPESYTSLWGESSEFSKRSLDRLNLQKSNHYKSVNFSRRLDMLETFRDLPDDINEPVTLDSDSEDNATDKENSPDVGLENFVGISKLKEKRGFVTNGELLQVYDDWRKTNQDSGKLGKTSLLDVKPFVANVGKLLSSRGVDIKFSESVLQSCFVLTLTKRMLTSEEAVKKFLDKNCIPFLEKTRVQQSRQKVESWKVKGSEIIGNLSSPIENLEHKFSEGRLARSQNRLQLGVVEDETECLERSWNCAQGKPQFFSDALRNQVRKLNMTFARFGKSVDDDSADDLKSLKSTDAEVPLKHKKACDELRKFGVEEKQMGAVVESVLEYVENPDSYMGHSE